MKATPFLIIFFLFSCSSKHTVPADILSQDKMKEILWDMVRADEFASNFERKDSTRSLKEKSIVLYEEIFRIHKTNKAQFEKSVDFYNLHPDLFKVVVDSLDKRKTQAYSESYRSPVLPVHDSLKRKDSFRIKDSSRLKFRQLPVK